MNYAHAASIESALVQIHLGVQAAAAHAQIAADAARRGGLITRDDGGEEVGGFAVALDLLVLKLSGDADLVAQVREMFDDELIRQGDPIAVARRAERDREAAARDAEVHKRLETRRRRGGRKPHRG